MNARQYRALALRDTDVDGALRRLSGNEQLYAACLNAFLQDCTAEEMSGAIARKAWDDAFTAAHALKGMAGNMGFVPLMHATGQLIVLIRGGRTNEIDEALERVNSCYRDIADAIHQFINFSDGVRRENAYEDGKGHSGT